MAINYLVFDIETSPLDWDTYSDSQKEYLIRGAVTEEEIEKKKSETGLSALTSHVVCIGLEMFTFDEESKSYKTLSRKAFSLDPTKKDDEVEEVELPTGDICRLSTEQNLLEHFWKIFTSKSGKDTCLISFNGRNFDAPFLMLRSALMKIKPSRDLMKGTKFNYPMHIDLIDKLTFYMAQQSGPTRRYNFDFYSQQFEKYGHEIHTPKTMDVNGGMVREMFADGKILEIAEYCMRDITSTWQLFLIWKEYLDFGN